MLILITILLALIPIAAILYPFLKSEIGNEWLDDESSPQMELERRWDAALSGLRSAELEYSIGNLDEEDYQWLRQQYMREAAGVMRAMELEEEQEEELLTGIEKEIQQVRQKAVGTSKAEQDKATSDAESLTVQRPAQESLGG